ncbi:MAG: PAS domain-containing protein [Minisyncoccia bacterium]
MQNSKEETVRSAESKKLALHYMETLTEVARESFLILDAKLKVISVNPIFYQDFQVSPKETEGKFIYELGNGQWNIPELKNLLEKILPEKKAVKNYEVKHVFETIGEKTILLNASQIDSAQLIILAMEDITSRKQLEEKLAGYTKGLEVEVAEQTKKLSKRVQELESLNKSMIGRELKMIDLKKEIEDLKVLIKNGNPENGR